MRRAFTLLELVVSMTLIALVFTVIPKMIFATNKSFEASMKEDALYNAMTLMGAVAKLPWDNNNTQNDQILSVVGGNADYLCAASTDFYRRGGFSGGRNCIGIDEAPMEASVTPGREDALYNDIDDYNGYSVTTASAQVQKYDLAVTVAYLSDPATGTLVDLASLGASGTTTNVKRITIRVANTASNQKTPFVSTLRYDSFNLGQFQIQRRQWQ